MKRFDPTALALSLSSALVLTSASSAQESTLSMPTPGGPFRVESILSKPWTATWGGAGFDGAVAIEEAVGGDLLVAGSTHSFNAAPGPDAWIARLDPRGTPRWELVFGGALFDEVTALLATPDGGCLAVGWTTSAGNGAMDGWIAKVSATGSVEWQRSYGGPFEDRFHAVAPSPGGYYVGGATATAREALRDVWVLEIDTGGDILWQKTFTTGGDDVVSALAATADGPMCVIASNSDLGGVPVPFFRPWLVKLDLAGDVQWQKTYNASGGDIWNDITAVDGGYIVAGEILAMAFFRGDVWVVRLDTNGEIEWDRRLGDNFATFFVDNAMALRPTPSGGVVLAGSTGTAGGGSEDLWVMELDANGFMEWNHAYGGAGFDNGAALVRTTLGDVVVAGFVGTPGENGAEALVLHLGDQGQTGSCGLDWPTLPNKWTDDLLIQEPVIAPSNTSVVPLPANLPVAFVHADVSLCSSE